MTRESILMNGQFINTNAVKRVDKLIRQLNGKSTSKKRKHQHKVTPPYPFKPRHE